MTRSMWRRLLLVPVLALPGSPDAEARTVRLAGGDQRAVSVRAAAPARLVVRVRGAARVRLRVRVRRAKPLRLALRRRWRSHTVALPRGRSRVRLAARGRGRSVVRLRVHSGSGPATPAPEPPAAPAPPPATPAAANPLAALPLWVDPDSQAAAARAAHPEHAPLLDRIATRPQATWLGEWSGDVRAAARSITTRAAAAGALPVLVAYAIPLRDCSGYSGGGAASPDAYRAWMRELAAGIGDRDAVVVLEPDALAMLDCLPTPDRETRLALLRDAVDVLAARPATVTYLDAGHPAWHAPDLIAGRLRAAGVARTRGFALNVSNYRSTPELRAYAHELAARLPGAHAALDTSRNGRGPAADGAWCNPPGRGLGAPPAADPSDPVVDALLWIKRPGESDGPCNGGPSAGGFWLDGALELARNAL